MYGGDQVWANGAPNPPIRSAAVKKAMLRSSQYGGEIYLLDHRSSILVIAKVEDEGILTRLKRASPEVKPVLLQVQEDRCRLVG